MTGQAARTCWIIGASSGIGEALARELAGRGWRLALSARRGDSLRQLAQELGPAHIAVPLDVTDAAAFDAAAAQVAGALGRIDSVVHLAAVYAPASIEAMDIARAREIVDVNLMGSLYCVHSVLPVLRAQGGGQLALCGSVAGYGGLPNAQPYGATKAAVINFAQSLRAEQARHNIDVRIINPGFVRTPMTDQNDFPMPMMIEPRAAAQSLADQLAGRGFEIHFPRRFTWLMKVLNLLPAPLYFLILRKAA